MKNHSPMLVLLLATALPAPAAEPTRTVVAGENFRASGLRRFLFFTEPSDDGECEPFAVAFAAHERVLVNLTRFERSLQLVERH